MALAPGARLGPYEVSGLIGAGGMGEVYRARDTRLDRTVALKVLPADRSADPDRRARFEREARTIAQLTHPHICTLYDVGHQDDATYLVMEHLAGETLADRLSRGPLPVAQGLAIGAQIADALAAAHKAGIVHRDLKPANVMLIGASGAGRPSAGEKVTVKLLDFGLAKLRAHGERPAVTLAEDAATQAPAATLTTRGTIVGTLPYMAPEQVQGQEADARTDLWALGAILYEMLTGTRAFEASSATSLVGAILEREPPPMATRQPLTPPGLERVVRRCLAKPPDDRWASAHDVAEELRWLSESASTPSGVVVPPRSRWRRFVVAALAIGALAGAVAAGWYGRGARSPTTLGSAPIARSLIDSAPMPRFSTAERAQFAWTPDGKALVFVGETGQPLTPDAFRPGLGPTRQLYLRSLDSPAAWPIPGTERTHLDMGIEAPVVSPDGKLVAFSFDYAVWKVPLAGGTAEVLCCGGLERPRGMAWAADGTLFLGGAGGPIGQQAADTVRPGGILQVVPDRTPSQATTLREDEISHEFPSLLPGDRVLLYTVRRRRDTWGGDDEIVAQVRASGERKTLVKDGTDARYVASGHLLFLRAGVLFAVPFDPERLEVRGTPIAVIHGVRQKGRLQGGQFAVSSTGTLAWVPAPRDEPARERTLVAVDRQGHRTPLAAPPRSYDRVRVSPDGRRLLVTVVTPFSSSIWIYDLVRGALTPVAADGEAHYPVWTPDGQRVVFQLIKSGRRGLAWVRADGGGAPEMLASGNLAPWTWSPNGTELLGVGDRPDLWAGVLRGSTLDVRWLPAEGFQGFPALSPDGQHLAYVENFGSYSVFVRPYHGPSARLPVSVGGPKDSPLVGRDPVWNPNGRELFYLGWRGDWSPHIMAVPVERTPTLAVGRARELFEFKGLEFGEPLDRSWDVAPDGQRFYFIGRVPPKPGSAPEPPVTHIRLVQNWLEELKARAPTGR